MDPVRTSVATTATTVVSPKTQCQGRGRVKAAKLTRNGLKLTASVPMTRMLTAARATRRPRTGRALRVPDPMTRRAPTA